MLINIMLAVFNMIPIAPLDGSQIFGSLISKYNSELAWKLQMYGPKILLGLILFGIMLTNKISSVNISHSNFHQGIAAVIVIGIFSILGWMILKTPWLQIIQQEPAQTVGKIGRLLMTEYLLPFEVASVLLLTALIGAAMLSRKAN